MKMPSSSTRCVSRPSFLGWLALLFIAFKLGHVGDVAGWSWWWVLAPLWLGKGGQFALNVLTRSADRMVKTKAAEEARKRKQASLL